MLRRLLLLPLVALAACRSEQPAPVDPAPARNVLQTAAQAPAPDPASPLDAVPDAATVVAVLRAGTEGCELERADAKAGAKLRLRVLTEGRGGCRGVALAFSPDGRRGAAIRVDAKGPEVDEHAPQPVDVMAWSIAVDAARLVPLPNVPMDAGRDGRVIDVGVRPDGAIVVVTAKQFDFADEVPKSLEFEGKQHPVPSDFRGFVALAHAFVFANGAWARVETRAVDDGPYVADGAPRLDAFKGVGPRIGLRRDDGDRITALPANDAPKGLAPHQERCAPEGWAFLGTRPGLFVGYLGSDTDQNAGGCLFRADASTTTEFPSNPLAPSDAARWTVRDGLVLGTDLDGAHATLWDIAAGTVVAQWKDTEQVQFWPRPSDVPAAPPAEPHGDGTREKPKF